MTDLMWVVVVVSVLFLIIGVYFYLEIYKVYNKITPVGATGPSLSGDVSLWWAAEKLKHPSL